VNAFAFFSMITFEGVTQFNQRGFSLMYQLHLPFRRT